MSLNYNKEQLDLALSSNVEETDLFASWGPVDNLNQCEDISEKNESVPPIVIDNVEDIPNTLKLEEEELASQVDYKNEEIWLDPCKFSGKIVRKLETTSDVHLSRHDNIAENQNSGDNSNNDVVTRKVTVLPPSVGYRGFCNVDDLSDKQRQPWKRLKSDSTTQNKGNSVIREYVTSDGQKVKVMRIVSEDPPKKIKKSQHEKVHSENVKGEDHVENDEFDTYNKLNLTPRMKKMSLKNLSPESTEMSSKRFAVTEKFNHISPKSRTKFVNNNVEAGKSNISRSYNSNNNNVKGKTIKRHCLDNDKKLGDKDHLHKLRQEKFMDNYSRTDQTNLSAPPIKRYKPPNLFKKKEIQKINSDIENKSNHCNDDGENEKNEAEEEEEEEQEGGAAITDNVLKDLDSVKAKLAKLSEEIVEGNKENDIDYDCKNSEEMNIKKTESQAVNSLSAKPVKNAVSFSISMELPGDDKQKHKQIDDKVERLDNLTKKKERNEKDRKAAQEYMRMKKVQWKEQQAQEQVRKKLAYETRQLKLQQLQQTQQKLLKQSAKKKSTVGEKPNWKGPIFEHSSPPPLPATATTSLAEQVMMSRKKSSAKYSLGKVNKSSNINKNVAANDLKGELLKNELLVNDGKSGILPVHQAKEVIEKGNMAVHLDEDRKSYRGFSHIDPPIISVEVPKNYEKTSICSAHTDLSILHQSKGANESVEAMTAEMKRLDEEFRLIRERSFKIDKTADECGHALNSKSNRIDDIPDDEKQTKIPVGSDNPAVLSSSVCRREIFTAGNSGGLEGIKEGGEKIESSDDRPHSSTQDDSISGGPLNELTDSEPPLSKPLSALHNQFQSGNVNSGAINKLSLHGSSRGSVKLSSFEPPKFVFPALEFLDERNDEPKWLKEFAAQPNPFNFITAVKLKMTQPENIEQSVQPFNVYRRDRTSTSVKDFDRKCDEIRLITSNMVQPCIYNGRNEIKNKKITLNDFKKQKIYCDQSEDTDAPSMVEEEIYPECVLPLVLDDLKLNLPQSLNSELTSCREFTDASHESSEHDIYYNGGDSCVKQTTFIIQNDSSDKQNSAKPLTIPDSIKSLALLPAKTHVCLPDDKINLSSSDKSGSKAVIHKELNVDQCLSVPDCELVLKTSGSCSSSASQSAVSSNNKSSNNNQQAVEFKEPRRYDSDRRKKLKLSNARSHNKNFLQEENFTIGNVFSPDALFLQFQAELINLDVCEAGLAQVAAAEQLNDLRVNSNLQPNSVQQPEDEFLEGESAVESEKSVSGYKKRDDAYDHANIPFIKNDNTSFNNNIKYENQEVEEKIGGQVVMVHSNEQLNQSIATAQSSTPLQSVDSFQVPSLVNEDDSIDEQSKMDDINETIDMNLNTVSSSATPAPADRSSSVSNLRFSFTNQRSVAKYSILIFDQLIKEQKLRSEQQKAAFKLREKALRDRVKAEFTLLEVQRRTLREKGLDDQAKNIKKKQRGLLLKWKQNQDEIVRQRSAEELTSKERIMMLLQQQNLVKMQMSTKNTLRKIKSAVATFASREQSRKKTSASGLLSGGNRCASLSSFDESSDNESRRVVHQNQEHHKRKSLNVSDVSGNSGVSSSSASDTGKLKKNRSTSAVLYKETTEDYSSDQNNSINWKELQQKKSHTRIVLDRSTSPFQLTPVESNLNKQTIVNSIVPSQTGSSDHVASIVDNTSRIISSIHGSSDLQSNNISEDLSKSSQLNARNTNTSRSRSGSVSQIQEELEGEMLSNSNILKIPVLPTKYNSDDLESPISSATGGSHSNRTKNESVSTAPSSPHQIRSSVIPSRQHSVSIKDPLTPQLPVGQCRTRRRCSSGSDDSVILSQNETFSEQSDLEVRLSALHEQLRQRKLEAEKLRKEQKRAQRERLKAKEQSLLKQIQAYDVYIEQVRKDLEQDMDASTIPIMKPLIKQTRVTLRKPDNVMNKTSFKQEKKSVASDESVSEASSLETTIQSPQQIQHSVEVQSDIDVVTKSTDSVSEVIETSNKPDIIEEVESSSGKWIDAADFFGDKTSDVEECLEENKNSVTESISDEQIYSEEINDLESKGISSDSKVESELPGIEENTTGEKSIESVNEVEENNLSIIESFKVNDEGFKSMEEPEESPRSIKELEESPSSDISQKNIQIEHTESAELQEVSTANEHLSSSNFIITVQSEHQDVENTLQKSVKDNDHLDSDNSIKSIRSDYQNTDDSAKTIEEKSDRSEVNISENSHDRNSSSITNDVPIIHSENSVIDTFESDIESSENYSDHDVDNIEKVCSNKSKICNELDFSLENKFPLPLVNIESESNDKSIDDKLSTDNESDIDQISPIHSDKVPINLLLDKSNDVNLSDTILSPSIPEEHSSESIKSGLDLGFSDVKKAENNDDDEEIELEETYLGEEEEAKLGDIEDKKFKKELNDEESLKIISESIDLKESSDDSGSLKLEDSFESKSSTGTELDNINNFNEKLNFDSDKSFSIHEDDLSNEIEDVIKVFVTEKEKVVEVKEVMYSTDDGDNDDVLIQENLIKEELHNDSDDDLFSYKTNKNNLCNIKDKRIDRITDKIFSDILKDSLSFSQKIFSDKLSNKYLNKDLDFETPFITALKKDKEREEKNNIENIMDSVLHKSVKEATDSIIKIYQKKTSFLMSSSQLLDNDKFKKLQEINSINTANQKIDSLVQQTVIPGELSPSKEQAFIVLSSTPSGNENNIKDAENSSDKKVDVKSIWLDEDMGLGRTCKEAEELRLQQLQIEQEIQQLERASAGQIGYDEHIPSYYYVREIPNKPPPPYTPPGQACIPTNHQDILAIVYTTTDYLYSAHSQGNDLSKLQPPNKLLALDDSPRSIYKRFLFDLTRQLILEAIDSGQDENLLPWEKTEYKRKCWIPQKTGEIIKHIVTDRVKVLFGFETRSVKENLIIRWSRKKRDKVDELLVRESQEEEQEWTDFSLDENAIKNKISLSILDSLLLETGTVLQAAFHNKMNRIRSCLLDT